MVFVINGRPGVGKTTFEQIVKEYTGESGCTILSTVDFIKKIALKAGWDGEKTPESRAYLSQLKDLFTDWLDTPFNKIKDTIEQISYDLSREPCGIDAETHHIFFVDSREPQEIERFCRELGAKSVLIRRFSEENKATSNHADADVFNYSYDYLIYNDGTKDDLRVEVEKWLKKIGYVY